MSRSRIVFLLIVIAAIGIVAAAQVLKLVPVVATPTPVPALQVEVATNPMAYEWVSEQAKAFNNQQPQVNGQPFQVRLTQHDDTEIWQTGNAWTPQKVPGQAWAGSKNGAL